VARSIHLIGHDAEIEADIDEDGADRAATVLGGNLLERGRVGVTRVVPPGGRSGDARLARGQGAVVRRLLLQIVAAGGEAAEPFFEGGGAEQAARDAGEDQREIVGAEAHCEEGEAGEDLRVGDVLAQRVDEIPAVGDKRVKDAKDLADARGHSPIGIRPAGFGW